MCITFVFVCYNFLYIVLYIVLLVYAILNTTDDSIMYINMYTVLQLWVALATAVIIINSEGLPAMYN